MWPVVAALQHLSESRLIEGERLVLTRQIQVVQHSAGLEHQRHVLDAAGSSPQ